jgi:CheY-like chemotaxis protein
MNSFSSNEAATERLLTSFEAERALAEMLAPQGAQPARRQPGQPPSVLLIEDSPHIQNLMRLLLARDFPGVTLHMASDGDSGLLECARLRPDALIVDIMLPGIDGALLVASLRSQPGFDPERLIVMTSLDAPDLEPYVWAFDGLQVVPKRQLPERLAPLLTRALSRRQEAHA